MSTATQAEIDAAEAALAENKAWLAANERTMDREDWKIYYGQNTRRQWDIDRLRLKLAQQLQDEDNVL